MIVIIMTSTCIFEKMLFLKSLLNKGKKIQHRAVIHPLFERKLKLNKHENYYFLFKSKFKFLQKTIPGVSFTYFLIILKKMKLSDNQR